jgi:hypothetical protein
MDDKERARLMKDNGPASGHFRLDFARNCALIGVVPHPQLVSTKHPLTVAEAEQKEADALAAAEAEAAAAAAPAEEKKEETPPLPVLPQPSPVVVSPSPGKGGKSGGSANKPNKPVASEPKLTPQQRAAADLAERMAAMTPEELAPVTEACVRGWVMDLGNVQALQMTVPSCKTLHTLRFWNASLTTRALTMLSECLKGSTITRMYIDSNPLTRSAGDEGGLVYSLMLAPSSPLQLLSLRSSRVTDDVCSELMRTLSANKNLLALDLWDNELTDKCAPDIARMLGVNGHLLSLNLSRNRLGDGTGVALASALGAQLISDKEEAKSLKKIGYRIALVKNRTFREANMCLKYLHLSDNYLSEVGLQSIVDMIAEQVRLNPSRGLVLNADGQEVQAQSLLPEHIQAEDRAVATSLKLQKEKDELQAKEDAAAAARVSSAGPAGAAGTPLSSRKQRAAAAAAAAGGTSAPGGKPVSAAAAAVLAANAAAAAAKEEESNRFPGQNNSIVNIDLRQQHCIIRERLWYALAYIGPLVTWKSSPTDVWSSVGTLDVRALDAAAAKKAEEERLAAQSEEEKLQEANDRIKAAEEAAAAAIAAAAEAQEQKKSSGKGSTKKKANKKSSED